MTAFSNGTQWDMFAAQWCNRCRVDEAFQQDADGAGFGCPIIMDVLVNNEKPVEWIEIDRVYAKYECTKFEEQK